MKTWLNRQVSLYDTHFDNTGRPATLGQILRTEFIRDLDTIIDLRQLDRNAQGYELEKGELKSTLQCFTPSALLATKAKGELQVIQPTGLIQFDFDAHALEGYDIEEVKRCVFDLPFIAFCGLSCSGDGFFALGEIAEPERLSDYAAHCFDVFEKYGISPDRSKGKKLENLRYVSYDKNMLIREHPEPLRIKRFKPSKPAAQPRPTPRRTSTEWVDQQLRQIGAATRGQRFPTVQRVAYTLGGTCRNDLLHDIETIIRSNTEFSGEESKYIKIAKDCFKDGGLKPLGRL